MAESPSSPALDDAAHPGLPRSPSEFDADPRVSFSKLDNKYLLETEEGEEFEYVEGLKRWVPVVGDHAPQYYTSSTLSCEDSFHGQE
jgi:HIV Tat-specific factor 1